MMDTGNEKITKKQALVADLYFNSKLRQKDIAHRLGISQQAISKILKKAKKNTQKRSENQGGLYFGGMVGKYNPPQHSDKNPKYWRIESLNFTIKPYYLYPRYFEIMKKRGNYSIPHKRWRLFLYKDVIRVQSKAGIYFKGGTRSEALREAEQDFNRFLYYASDKYGFKYEKEGRTSISCNNMEIERENSKFAKGYIKESQENYLQIRDVAGKVCFFIDQSKSDEHGYKGKDAYSHSENLEPYIKDFLYNNPLNNSQLTSRLNDVVTALEKITELIKR